METRPGIYTTEFWATVIGVLINLANIVGVWDWASNWHSGVLTAIILAAYNYSRGQAKSGVGADPTNANNYRLIPRNPQKR